MSNNGAAPRAAVSASNARAEASRKNGARSRGPKTQEGKARSAQNALKHGLRAQKYVVLPEEDGAEFAGLEAAMLEELAPVGALQTVLARRIVVAAWRLARADRIETELFAERHIAGGSLGLALIRDGNGTRSFETLLRYRGAAMAEFWRALKTLKALQAEQAVAAAPALAAHPLEMHSKTPAARPPLVHRPQPDEPESGAELRLDYVMPEPPTAGCIVHEAPASWTPNEPDQQRAGPVHAQAEAPESNEPQADVQPPSRATLSRHASSGPVAATPELFRADLRLGTGPRSDPGPR